MELILIISIVLVTMFLIYYTQKYKETFVDKKLYSHIIKRPLQKNLRKCPSGQKKGDVTIPVDASVDSKHYGMRPILNSNNYHLLLEKMFNYVSTDIEYDDSKFINHEEFSNENEYKLIMNFLMSKINTATKEIPEFKSYSQIDTWNGEQFVFLNEKIFIFQEKGLHKLTQQERVSLAKKSQNKDKKIIVHFNLYNTLRTTSTDVIAVLLLIDNNLFIKSMEFSSQKNEKWVDFASLSKKQNINTDCIKKDTPSWIYGNVIENESFNCKGFKSEKDDENYTIKGGVPEELLQFLEKHEKTHLLPCETLYSLDSSSDAHNTVYDKNNNKINFV